MSFQVHLLTFAPHISVAVLQDKHCEEIGLRHFGRSIVDTGKTPAVATLSAREQEALIEASVASHVADIRCFLCNARTEEDIMHANDQYALLQGASGSHLACMHPGGCPDLPADGCRRSQWAFGTRVSGLVPTASMFQI